MRRIKIRKNIKISRVILVVLALVFFFTFIIFNSYSKNTSPKVINAAEIKLNEFIEGFLSNNIGYDILKKSELEDILVINKNKEGEILYVDYNLEHAYKTLDVVTEKLYDLIDDLEKGNIKEYNTQNIVTGPKGMALKVPLFIGSNNILLANLGPDIYVKINFVGSILTNIRSEIKNYGLNNALVELYVTIKITASLITPVKKGSIEIPYDVLIASKVINGRVPEIYGGAITTKSNVLSIPIE